MVKLRFLINMVKLRLLTSTDNLVKVSNQYWPATWFLTSMDHLVENSNNIGHLIKVSHQYGPSSYGASSV